MEVVPRWKTEVRVGALTVDFTRLYFNVVCLLFHCWCHAVVIIVSRIIHLLSVRFQV